MNESPRHANETPLAGGRLLRRAERVFSVGMVVVASLAIGATRAADESSPTWAFVPLADEFRSDALLDLRNLNERVSGETGFVGLAVDGNSFVRGDGAPLRFWAVGSEVYRRPSDATDDQWQARIDYHCRWLAKRGVNMVRLHLCVANTREGADIDDVDQSVVEGVFRFVKAAKQNGIYLTISPYYANHRTPTSWQLAGYSDTHTEPWGAIFIDPRMQAAYRTWVRKLYTTVNPHTGLAICRDPTVAVLQIHNEDSVFFWTFGQLPAAQQRYAGKLFGKWLITKYGSLEKATSRWPDTNSDTDEFDQGIVGLLGPYHQSRTWGDQRDCRIRDEVAFLAELQRTFYAEMGDYLRNDLGCQQLLNASNWRTASDSRLKGLERWTYAALDIDAENEYFGLDWQHEGPSNNYRIDAGHFIESRSCLFSPLELPCNFKLQSGHPFMVTETSWKHPNLYQAEGPFLTALYQSIGGVDAVFWFTADQPGWCTDPRRKIWASGDSYAHFKWSCSTPMLVGMFPAASVVYRRCMLSEGDPLIREARPFADLVARKPPAIDDNEIYAPNWDPQELSGTESVEGTLSRATFLVGPVVQELGANQASLEKSNYSSHLNASQGTITSSNEQVVWDYRRGICSVNNRYVQGVVGFLRQAGGTFSLTDVELKSNNDYAAVTVVSLDEQPLCMSSRVLVQIGTSCRLTDWETVPATYEVKQQTVQGERVVSTGRPPWQIANTQLSLRIANNRLTAAWLLDANGCGVELLPVDCDEHGLRLDLPANAMYVVLCGESLPEKYRPTGEAANMHAESQARQAESHATHHGTR